MSLVALQIPCADVDFDLSKMVLRGPLSFCPHPPPVFRVGCWVSVGAIIVSISPPSVTFDEFVL